MIASKVTEGVGWIYGFYIWDKIRTAYIYIQGLSPDSASSENVGSTRDRSKWEFKSSVNCLFTIIRTAEPSAIKLGTFCNQTWYGNWCMVTRYKWGVMVAIFKLKVMRIQILNDSSTVCILTGYARCMYWLLFIKVKAVGPLPYELLSFSQSN